MLVAPKSMGFSQHVVRLRVGKRKPLGAFWRYEGETAWTFNDTEEMTAEFTKGDELLVEFSDQGRSRITSFSLTGARSALQRLAKDCRG